MRRRACLPLLLLHLAPGCGPLPVAEDAVQIVAEQLAREEVHQQHLGSLLDLRPVPEVEPEGEATRVTFRPKNTYGIRLPVYSCRVDPWTGEASGCTITHPFGWTGTAQHPRPRECIKAPLPDGRQVIRCEGLFHLEVPGDLRQVLTVPIDSNVAGYRGESLELSFDHGMYSNSLEPGHLFDERAYVWETTVGQRRVRMATYTTEPDAGGWTLGAAMHVREVGAHSLTIHATCRDGAGLEQALLIFHSIGFEDREP